MHFMLLRNKEITPQRWAPARVWPQHAVLKLHSIESELTVTNRGWWFAEAERRIPWCSSLRKVYCSTHRTDWYCSPARVCTACVWTVTRQPEESVQLTARHRVTAVLSTCLFCFGPVYSDLSTQIPPPKQNVTNWWLSVSVHRTIIQ